MMIEVSAGDYYVVAIEDANNNFFFDTDTDKSAIMVILTHLPD